MFQDIVFGNILFSFLFGTAVSYRGIFTSQSCSNEFGQNPGLSYTKFRDRLRHRCLLRRDVTQEHCGLTEG